MTNAEMVRVEEITPMRRFQVGLADDQDSALVILWAEEDDLWCVRHEAYDNCDHTRRVRLSGLLKRDAA